MVLHTSANRFHATPCADTHPDDPTTPHYAEALTASSYRRMVHIVPSTRLASSGESARVVTRRQLLLTPM
jgi:hypothetical protein